MLNTQQHSFRNAGRYLNSPFTPLISFYLARIWTFFFSKPRPALCTNRLICSLALACDQFLVLFFGYLPVRLICIPYLRNRTSSSQPNRLIPRNARWNGLGTVTLRCARAAVCDKTQKAFLLQGVPMEQSAPSLSGISAAFTGGELSRLNLTKGTRIRDVF